MDSLRADRGDNREAFDAWPRPLRVHNHYAHFTSFAIAVVGALVVLAVYRLILRS